MIQIREIVGLVALNFGVTANEIIAHNGQKVPLLARKVAIYLARKHTRQSTKVIGKAIGDRDHTTVLHAIERLEAELKGDVKLKALVEALSSNIEFRERMEAVGGVDVLAVAQHIAAQPMNRAIGASVMQVAALAATVVDLWEIALAAEELSQLYDRRRELRRKGLLNLTEAEWSEGDALDQQFEAIMGAITDELAAMRGAIPNTDEETDDGNAD